MIVKLLDSRSPVIQLSIQNEKIMREYEDKEKEIVTRRECVKASCDMCGREAEMPESIENFGGFEWGGAGSSGGIVEAKFFIDGDSDIEKVDLCWECASWLIERIKQGKIRD